MTTKITMKRSGFTRIEVCLLVAATTVVGAAVLPAFAQFGIFTRARENARRSLCQSNLKQIALGVLMYTQDYDERYPSVTGGPISYNYGWATAIYPYLKNMQLFQCPSEKHKGGTDPKRPGYTDYWYNRNLSRTDSRNIKYVSVTLLAGDGDGGAAQSNARYAINALPRAWTSTARSPARRHLDSANYAYTDGHIKWLKPQRVTTAPPSPFNGLSTFKLK
jgi:prepilin-type processing-associated H-X9-DG protein